MPRQRTKQMAKLTTQIATAAAIGGLAGASLGARRGLGQLVGWAVAGAAVLGGSEAIARTRQRPNEIPALPHRILMSAALAAPIGWAADQLAGPRPTTVGLTAGTVAGVMGVRPQKVALGPAVGLAAGLGAGSRQEPGTRVWRGRRVSARVPDDRGSDVP